MKELTAALAKAQSEMKPLQKKSKNPFFKSNYADLAETVEVILSVLSKNGLSIMQGAVFTDGAWVIETRLDHVSGDGKSYCWPIIAKGNSAQDFASGATYARRYSLQAIVCAAAQDEDDDGERATGRANVMPTQAVKKEDTDYGDYLIKFGKFKHRHLKEVSTDELASYLGYIENKARLDDKEIKGVMLEFMNAATSYLETQIGKDGPPVFDESEAL